MKTILFVIWETFLGRCFHHWIYNTIYLHPKLTHPSERQDRAIEIYLSKIKLPVGHRYCEVCGKSQIRVNRKWFGYSDSYDYKWMDYRK